MQKVNLGGKPGTNNPVSRRERKKRQNRVRLLQCAYEAMGNEKGGKLSIAYITDAADIGFGTFYNYFDSMEDLASQVLTYVVNDVGRRNDLATISLKTADPAAVQAMSIRLLIREMLSEPMWRWWLNRPQVLVERMTLFLRPFGIRDFKLGVDADQYKVEEKDAEIVLGQITWMIIGGVIDIREKRSVGLDEAKLIEIIMRAMGVPHNNARRLAEMELPAITKANLDFSGQLAPVLSVLLPNSKRTKKYKRM